MSKLQALIALRDKVKGETDAWYFGWASEGYLCGDIFQYRGVVNQAYNGSLDAAMALHKTVLPDAWAHVRMAGKYGHATVDVDGEEFEANNIPDNPARAWLLAILEALIAKEETDNG